ncbi:SBBP repeat-containing protein [Bacteriovoracaceae bacterium]|nr:SBBP repeat-containing protein [Bacteriovoracaceae bacterium]
MIRKSLCFLCILLPLSGCFINDAFIAGTTNETPSTILNSAGGTDAFITKVSSAGVHEWSYKIGGPLTDSANAIATDSVGNAFIVGGKIYNIDMDPTSGTDFIDYVGNGIDSYITKINSDGTYGFSKIFYGSSATFKSIAIDSSDNIFLSGYFGFGYDFDPSEEGQDVRGANGNTSYQDVFLVKLDSNGIYQWTLTFGGTGAELANDMVLDPSGNIIIMGTFQGTVDFDPTSGTDTKSAVVDGFNNDMFLTKIYADGTYAWTNTFQLTTFGSASEGSLDTDSAGNIFFTGYFRDTVDFDPTAGTDSRTSSVFQDMYLTKINADGTYGFSTVYTSSTGTGSGVSPTALTIDSSNNVHIVGYFINIDFTPSDSTTGSFDAANSTIPDSFLAKFDSTGTLLTASIYGNLLQHSIKIDSAGDVITGGALIGSAGNVDFDPGAGTVLRSALGDFDVYLNKITSAGVHSWVSIRGDTGDDYVNSIAIGADDAIIAAGIFELHPDFNP